MKETLMGNDAIAWGLIHANVDMVSGYPGTPSSEILGMVQKIKAKLKLPVYAEWATNEKVGFEVAYAGAIAGKRTAATMKQVGLNVASDALMSAAYIGNTGGFLRWRRTADGWRFDIQDFVYRQPGLDWPSSRLSVASRLGDDGGQLPGLHVEEGLPEVVGQFEHLDLEAVGCYFQDHRIGAGLATEGHTHRARIY